MVLDLMLPDRDGWEITRIVRNDQSLGAMPIIMLTARVEDTDKIIGLELGADDYMTKPFNAREIVARVRALLRRVQFGRIRRPRSCVRAASSSTPTSTASPSTINPSNSRAPSSRCSMC